MSRLGEWFLGVITPYPRLASWLFYVRHPHLFFAKAWAKLRRLRREWACRSFLQREKLFVEVGSPGTFLYTVATPVWRVAEEHLRAAIASVVRQTYPHWELWLANDASPDPHVHRVLDEAARHDSRIKVMHLKENRGIAGASDEILARARGEWVAFLDHDDLLHPRALELISAHLKAHPNTDWVFTDEDKVDERGRHREPCFKPGWSRHLLLTFNYAAHLRVVRRTCLARVGGHRRGFDGAQDYDLALRVLAGGGRFSHLRGVLYHWRVVPGSMARAAADKPAAHTHALAALHQHAQEWPQGGAVSVRVVLPPASFFQVRRVADPAVKVSLLCQDPPPLVGDRVQEVVPLDMAAPPEVVREAVQRCSCPVVIRWPVGSPDSAELEELLALLQVPGTAMVAPRWVYRGRVSGSGWWVCQDRDGGRAGRRVAMPRDATALHDPWRGLRLGDPGYLNLALVPGPRAALPAVAWIAWRNSYLAAWEAGAGAPAPWRVWLGLARAEQEVVVTPTVSVEGLPPPPPAPPPPNELPRHGSPWLEEFGLTPTAG